MHDRQILGAVGTGLGVLGSTMQTQEILQTISIIITIIGGLITWIIIPLVNWYQKSKKDGKITEDEIEEGLKTLQDGIDKTKEEVKKHGEN